MEISVKEMWTVLHGMILGSVFLLAYAGAVADLYALKAQWLTVAGASKSVKRLKIGLWTMSAISWVTVITGTWMVYIWYRAVPVAGSCQASPHRMVAAQGTPISAVQCRRIQAGFAGRAAARTEGTAGPKFEQRGCHAGDLVQRLAVQIA